MNKIVIPPLLPHPIILTLDSIWLKIFTNIYFPSCLSLKPSKTNKIPIQTEGQTDIKMVRRIDRQMVREADIQIDLQTYVQINRKTLLRNKN